MGFGVWGLGFGVWGSVWKLGFGVEGYAGLGFGVWSFGPEKRRTWIGLSHKPKTKTEGRWIWRAWEGSGLFVAM